MEIRNTLIIISLFFATCIQSNAQQYWTLEKCILKAVENSIAVDQASLAVKSSEINLNQSRQDRLPNLGASSSAFWNFGRTIDPTTNQFITQAFFSNNYGLNSGFTLYNGMLLTNSIKQNKANLYAALEEAEQVKIDVALTVANAYLQVLFAQENIQIANRQLELSQQQLDQTLKSIQAGTLAESEKVDVEAQVILSEQGVVNANNNLDIAMLGLKQALRLPADEAMEIITPENVEVSTNPDLISFEEAFNIAVKNRPDLRAGEFRKESAAIGITIAKSSYYPSINVGGSLSSVYANNPFTNADYTTQLDNNLSYGFGASLNIPIYSRGSTRNNVSRAKINAENAALNYEQTLDQLRTNVQQSLANARAAKKTLEASEKALEAQKLAFENTTKRLEIGASNSFEWENQKTQLENAEYQRVIDKYNYLFNIKILEFYLGKPLKL